MPGHVGEIRIFAFNFVPSNYLICDGRKLGRGQYQRLYETIGTAFTYVNSDDNTFAIPDLRDRFVKHPGTEINLGAQKGVNEIILSENQMPEHDHNVRIEVDANAIVNDTMEFPNGTFLNNNAKNFSEKASDNTFLGGITQNSVGNSLPISIKNAYVKMVYAIRYQNDDPNTDEDFIGEIRIWPNSETGLRGIPKGWKLCNGDTYSEATEQALSAIIGAKFGRGSDGNPKLPDFRDKFATGTEAFDKIAKTGGKTRLRLDKNNLPPHTHNVKLGVNNDADSKHSDTVNNGFINKEAGPFSEALFATEKPTLGGLLKESKGGFEEIDITNPSVGLNYIINTEGLFEPGGISNYVGEIKMYAGHTVERIESSHMIPCFGQNILISDLSFLFTLIQTRYGGNGKYSFKLPDLRNRVPTCAADFNQVGESGGANHIQLTPENLPPHNHNVKLTANHTADGKIVSITNGILTKDAGPYSGAASRNTHLGGVKEDHYVGEAVDIRNPFLSINYLICTNGLNPR